MICAFLLFSGAFKSSKEVLSFYAGKRTFDSNGVTIPSQRRYVDYFSTKISRGLEYSPIRLMLEAIILSRLPMAVSPCWLQPSRVSSTVLCHQAFPHSLPVRHSIFTSCNDRQQGGP